jgi:parvulin-like peptidyl-prolyl isomerase
MKPTRVVLSVLVALAVLVAAACGGNNDQSVPADDVAVVDGTPITKTDLSALLGRAKKSYTTQKRAFPKAGTAEYQALQSQAVAFLVQRSEYNKQADKLKITVTDKEIQARIDQVKKQYFSGSETKLEQQLKVQGYTTDSFRADIGAQLLSEKIYDEVTKDAKVTDAQVAKYYAENKKSQYEIAESRDVRHILVKTKAEADKIYAEIKAGGDFAALAKKYSLDTGSKANGGKLTITRGQTVPAFDSAAFLLTTNQVSRPVKTQFGYHVIQPISAIRPGSVTPLKDVKAKIKASLVEKAKTDAITAWTTQTKKDFASKIAYAVGFEPPAAATDTATDTATTTG